MDGTFNYHGLVEKIWNQGLGRNEPAKRDVFLELDQWHTTFFESENEKAAAIRVGLQLFQANTPLVALYFAFRLYKGHRKAFSEFQNLVKVELTTNRLLMRELVEELQQAEENKIKAQKEAEEKRTKEFTLAEFYEKVWSTPASTLAAELGISDVMIGKICRKYGIPKPPLGYWAKYYAGKKVRQARLPDILANSSVKIKITR